MSTLLISRFGFLATEGLSVKKMVQRPDPVQDSENGEFLPNGAGSKAKLNRSIHVAAPAKLLQMLRDKAADAGSWFGEADTKVVKPTQRCHRCGTLVLKNLSERWHNCQKCGLHCDRDENAARTILRWFHENHFWQGTCQTVERWSETPPITAQAVWME